MKRVLLISILSALCVAACGEKSNLGLKGRPLDPAQKGPATAKNTGEIVLPKDADNRILKADSQVTREVLFGKEASKLTVLCATNLGEAITIKSRIKMLGGGQVLVRQSAEETTDIVNFVCKAPESKLTGVEENENVASMVLTQGQPSFVNIKANNESNDLVNLQIVCGNADEIAKNASKVLMNESEEDRIQMVIGLNTKILVEIKTVDKVRNYALISCQAASTEVAPKVEETAVIEEKTAAQ
jgi:hypothetical protein